MEELAEEEAQMEQKELIQKNLQVVANIFALVADFPSEPQRL